MVSTPNKPRGVCDCLHLLKFMGDMPDGPVRSVEGGTGIQLPSGELQRWEWCPDCGGALGAFRPELIQAYADYREARETTYAPASAARTREQIAVECRQYATETNSSDYHITFLDSSRSIEVTASYDPDHETWVSLFAFAPDRTLSKSPFDSSPKATRGRRSPCSCGVPESLLAAFPEGNPGVKPVTRAFDTIGLSSGSYFHPFNWCPSCGGSRSVA
jgi:hypothetical protein